MSEISPRIEIAGTEWPPALTGREWWVIADPADKQPRAPWDHGGSAHKVKWNRNLEPEERPETTHEEAVRWSEFPDFTDLYPSIILPPEHENITLIDLDDVIHDGMISPPALEILRMAGGYAEVSQSGDGIHTFVRGHLPPQIGRVIEYFDESDESKGQIELYDHGRVVVMPGRHLAGTPLEIPDGQRVIDSIVEEYVIEECSECGEEAFPKELSEGVCRECRDVSRSSTRRGDRPTGASAGSRSPYWNAEVADVVHPIDADRTGDRIQGAHPCHGATSPGKADSDSSNFAIFTSENYWRCFAHGTWGGALDLVAMDEGIVKCRNFTTDWLHECDDETFLDVCLAARDKHGFTGEPPYRALVSVARQHDLALANEEKGILGSAAYEVALELYERL